jgi:hypothetical protein
VKRPAKRKTAVSRSPSRSKKKGSPADSSTRGELVSSHEGTPSSSPPPPVLVSSPHAILDEAVADAARTIAAVAGGQEVSREQLAAAQDILNRKGITSGGQKTSAIPEEFARAAFGYVFKILGLGEIKWPATLVAAPSASVSEALQQDAFNEALLEG